LRKLGLSGEQQGSALSGQRQIAMPVPDRRASLSGSGSRISRLRDQMKRFSVVRDGSPITVRDEGPLVRTRFSDTRCRRLDPFPRCSPSAMFSPLSKLLGNL
jgi:hypothetical protein